MEKKDASQEQVAEEPVPQHLTSVQDAAMGVSSIAHTNATQKYPAGDNKRYPW